MSKARGLFPLFIATSFGIINGLWVFGPAFKEQQEKKSQEGQPLEVAAVEVSEIKELRDAEERASRSKAAEAALRPVQTSKSWWQSLGGWTKEQPPPAITQPKPIVESPHLHDTTGRSAKD